MNVWRNCQYPITASVAKAKTAEPAAKPSSPSVRLTALADPISNNTASTAQPTVPRASPGELDRVKESSVLTPLQRSATMAKATATAS